jgi:hypothetical protein
MYLWLNYKKTIENERFFKNEKFYTLFPFGSIVPMPIALLPSAVQTQHTNTALELRHPL